jgi:hypothetical protein
VPVYNGEPVRLSVDGNYSIKILDKQGGQVYYIHDVYEGQPLTDEDLPDINPVWNFDVLDSAANSTDQFKIYEGASLNIAERTAGNGGGAMGDVVLSSSVTTDARGVIQCVGIPTLAIVLRLEGFVDVRKVTNGDSDLAAGLNYLIGRGFHNIKITEPTVRWILTEPVNLTGRFGVTIEGLCTGETAVPQILAEHTGHCFDTAGSKNLTFNNVNVEGSGITTPSTLFFLARNATADSSGQHLFNNCGSKGFFADAVYYNYATEETRFNSSVLWNSTASASVITITADNIESLSSTFIPIATGHQPTTVHAYSQLSITKIGNTGSKSGGAIVLQGVNNASFDAVWIYAPYSKAAVFVDSNEFGCNALTFTNLKVENDTSIPEHAIYFSEPDVPSLVTHFDISVTGGEFNSADASIKNEINSRVQLLKFNNNINHNPRALDMYLMDFSDVTVQGTDIVSRSSFVQNRFRVTKGAINFLTDSFNVDNAITYYDDAFSYESGTWVPTLSSSVSGGLLTAVYTAQTGCYTVKGKEVTFQFDMEVSSSALNGASGDLMMKGMPTEYHGATETVGELSIFTGITGLAGYTTFASQHSAGSSALRFYASGQGLAAMPIDITSETDRGTLRLSGSINFVMP